MLFQGLSLCFHYTCDQFKLYFVSVSPNFAPIRELNQWICQFEIQFFDLVQRSGDQSSLGCLLNVDQALSKAFLQGTRSVYPEKCRGHLSQTENLGTCHQVSLHLIHTCLSRCYQSCIQNLGHCTWTIFLQSITKYQQVWNLFGYSRQWQSQWWWVEAYASLGVKK